MPPQQRQAFTRDPSRLPADGFGREIQKKIQAEPGPFPGAKGKIIVGADGQPEMTPNDVSPRWVGSGWTVFNNKGKPVRQYEPFFTDTHRFEFDVRIGVSPVLFYDPVERVVATLHPNHTWEKVVFDPWRQETWDVNDTVLRRPQDRPDVGDFFSRLAGCRVPAHLACLDRRGTRSAWRRAIRIQPSKRDAGRREGRGPRRTPTVAHSDSLGRPSSPSRTTSSSTCNAADLDGTRSSIAPASIFDIEGNQREVIDAKDRVVMRYDYDMLGNRIHQASMEAGERWMLNDVAGKPIRAWDSRGHRSAPPTTRCAGPPTPSCAKARAREPVCRAHRLWRDQPNPEANNLRGRCSTLRSGGRRHQRRVRLQGQPAAQPRQLAGLQDDADWSANPPLEAETFTSTRYDALNRPIQLIPDSDHRRTTATSSSRSTTKPTCWSGWTLAGTRNPARCSTQRRQPHRRSPTSTTTPRASAR